MFKFDLAVSKIVKGLTDDRPIDTKLIGDAAEFRYFPCAMIGKAIVSDFPLRNQIPERADSFRDIRVMIFAMQIVNVDVIGIQSLEAAFYSAVYVFAGGALTVRILTAWTGEFCSQDPIVALVADSIANDHF